MNAYYLVLRRNPEYFKLWVAQAISLLGDWFDLIAISALVSRLTQGSGLAISGLLLARVLPPLLVSPYAGVLVDRFNRKTLLIISDVMRAIIVLGLLFATTPERLWVVYVLTILQFAMTAIFEPAQSAIMPAIVRPEDLVRANTLGSVTWSVMLAAGAAIGGSVAALFGTQTALIINSLSFLLSAYFIVSMVYKPTPKESHVSQGHQTGTVIGQPRSGSLMEGLKYVLARPGTFAAILIKAGGNFGNIDAVMTIYATQLFVLGENGTGSLGILYAAFGIGAVLGPAFSNRFNDGSVRGMRRLIILAYALVTMGWIGFGLAPTLLLASVAIILKAMGSAIYWTYSSIIIQKITPDEYLGRVFSLDMVGFRFMTVVSIVISGAATQQAGADNVRWVVIGMAAFSLIPLLLWGGTLPALERRELTENAIV